MSFSTALNAVAENFAKTHPTQPTNQPNPSSSQIVPRSDDTSDPSPPSNQPPTGQLPSGIHNSRPPTTTKYTVTPIVVVAAAMILAGIGFVCWRRHRLLKRKAARANAAMAANGGGGGGVVGAGGGGGGGSSATAAATSAMPGSASSAASVASRTGRVGFMRWFAKRLGRGQKPRRSAGNDDSLGGGSSKKEASAAVATAGPECLYPTLTPKWTLPRAERGSRSSNAVGAMEVESGLGAGVVGGPPAYGTAHSIRTTQTKSSEGIQNGRESFG
ncbi:hypothetical protein HK104_002673, partial [Borealophlyctis nickersoniae]